MTTPPARVHRAPCAVVPLPEGLPADVASAVLREAARVYRGEVDSLRLWRQGAYLRCHVSRDRGETLTLPAGETLPLRPG